MKNLLLYLTSKIFILEVIQLIHCWMYELPKTLPVTVKKPLLFLKPLLLNDSSHLLLLLMAMM